MASFSFEPLEPRQLRAATITITTDANSIHIAGDGHANSLRLSSFFGSDESGPDLVVDAPLSTRVVVNGQLHKSKGTRIAIGSALIDVDLAGGDDTLSLFYVRNYDGPGVRVHLGSGDDVCEVAGQLPRFSLYGDSGNDTLIFDADLAAEGNVSVLPGSGDDRVTFGSRDAATHPTIAGKLEIQDLDGISSLSIRDLVVGGRTSITTGNAADTVQLISSTFTQFLTLSTAGGDDQIDLSGTTYPAGKTIDAGAGDNHIAYGRTT